MLHQRPAVQLLCGLPSVSQRAYNRETAGASVTGGDRGSDHWRVNMSETALEERVARLERLVDGLVEHQLRYPAPGKDWRGTVGMFDGDPIFREMLDEVFRRREKERRQARDEEAGEGP